MAGRPRNAELTARLLAATLELLATSDYGDLTIDSIAARARVNKPAVYRRYRNKSELVVEAVRSSIPGVDVGDMGDSDRELEALIFTALPYELERTIGVVLALTGGARANPDIREAVREHLLLPFRAMAEALIARAQERGIIRGDVTPEMAFEMLNGQFFARVAAGRDVGPRWLRGAYETWRKVLAPPSTSATPR